MRKDCIMMTRRTALKTTAIAAAACATLRSTNVRSAEPPSGPFTLPPLPYPTDALEPHIDAKTMEIHHDKHHAAYVTNLNKALESAPGLASKSAEEVISNLSSVPEAVRTAVRNNGGGHVNHSMFWKLLKKAGGGGQPSGPLAQAINESFGDLEQFKTKFEAAGAGRFGSGW